MKGRFEGWYYKQQSAAHTLALIAGRAGGGAFIQVLTERRSYNITYGLRDYERKGERIRVGGSEFSPRGVRLDIQSRDLTLSGSLRYTGLSPLVSDIMGPFRFLPMQCRHGITSMLHRVDGGLLLNAEAIDFTGSRGYIESDSGSSFPRQYMWVQCNDFLGQCSVMASAALIPLAGLHFWGCIAAVWLNGREYRLASYRGARVAVRGPNRLVLSQGRLSLDIEIQSAAGHELLAPRSGSMSRIIRENAACPARFRLCHAGRVLFEASSARASYEYDMGAP